MLRGTVKPEYVYETAFQVQAKKKRVDKHTRMECYFAPGSVAAWYRPAKSIWHYAIVVTAMGSDLKVIHNDGFGVVEDDIDVTDNEKAPGDMYAMEYGEKLLRENPVTLVLARARARLEDKTYNILNDNCETFVSYCKMGINKSMQVNYCLRKAAEAGGEALVGGLREAVKTAVTVKTGATVAVSKIEEMEYDRSLGVAADIVGAGLLFLIEAISTGTAIKKFHNKRKAGDFDRQKLIAESVERTLEALTGAGACEGFGVLGGFLFRQIPVGGEIAIFGAPVVGSVLAGLIGSAGGKAVGDKIGQLLGKFIATHFRNDTAIHDLADLHEGDHVVVSRHLFHQGEHVIILETDPNNRRLHVIHKRHRHGGVLEDWLDVDLPVYRVTWSEKNTRSSVLSSLLRASAQCIRHFVAIISTKLFSFQC